jgi:long-chain acyl-CoA synthetase
VKPFDQSQIARDARGIARYQNRAHNLVEMLRHTVESRANAEAIVEIGTEIGANRVTYTQLWDHAARLAGGLRSQGIRKGDRVAIRLPNGLDWCLAFFGIQLAGAIAVPVNTRFSEPEIEYVLNDSGSQFVLQNGRAFPQGPPSPTPTSRHKTSPPSSTPAAPPAFPKAP